MGTAAFSHLDEHGRVKMVDVGAKSASLRRARAWGEVRMAPATLAQITAAGFAKGEVLAVARVAGIMAAKQTGTLIPLCHPLPLEQVSVELLPVPARRAVVIIAEARVHGKTGVEMEAFTAVSLAALTIYDMCKAVDRKMVIREIALLEKRGGRSGHFINPDYGRRLEVPKTTMLEAGWELGCRVREQDGRRVSEFFRAGDAAAGGEIIGRAAGGGEEREFPLIGGDAASVCLLGDAVLLPVAAADDHPDRETRLRVVRGGRVADADLLAVV